jgi:hypothetical protein
MPGESLGLSGLAACFEHDGSLQPRGADHEQADLSCRRQWTAPTFHEDMTVRGFSEKTCRYYIRIVAGFATFLGRSPDTATAEDIRRFQVHQSELGRPSKTSHAIS